MKFGSTHTILGIVMFVSMLGTGAMGQTAAPKPKAPAKTAAQPRAAAAKPQDASPEKQVMADDLFKNIQVLKGLTVRQFMQTMGFFSASLGANCTYCHVPEAGGNWARYADDNEHKQTARKMVLMMNGINQAYFGGKREVTCYSCHRFGFKPKVTPNLAEQYGAPPPDEPDEIAAQAPGAPSADQVLDKYIQAIGGAKRLAAITSVVAKGTYQGYDDTEQHAIEIYAKAPDQFTSIVHNRSGNNTTTYDGRSGWMAAPDVDTPVPVYTLVGHDLADVRLDATLALPARIKESLTDWRVGYPATIDDHDVVVVQGMNAVKSPVKLYFDKETGLLLRVLRYTEVPLGTSPEQVDFSDYREVSGVKIPFKKTATWTDGRASTELKTVQLNVPIPPTRFAKPTPPVAPRAVAKR